MKPVKWTEGGAGNVTMTLEAWRDSQANAAEVAMVGERIRISSWLRLQARGLIGTQRVAETNTLTLCADAIEHGGGS